QPEFQQGELPQLAASQHGNVLFRGGQQFFHVCRSEQTSAARPVGQENIPGEFQVLPTQVLKGGDGEVALFPVNDPAGEQAFRRFLQDPLSSSGQLDFRRHGGRQLHQFVI